MRSLVSVILLCIGVMARADTLVVLGDSISAAYGLDKADGWVSLLEQQLTEHCDNISVKNASVSGETTAGGLARLPAILEETKPSLLVIELGGNDGLRGLSPKVMQQNLKQMIQLGKQAGARVVVLGIYVPPNLGAAYSRLFEQAFVAAVEAEQVPFHPFFLDKVFDQPELMQDDGLHPTAAAQPQLLENGLMVMAPEIARICPAFPVAATTAENVQ